MKLILAGGIFTVGLLMFLGVLLTRNRTEPARTSETKPPPRNPAENTPAPQVVPEPAKPETATTPSGPRFLDTSTATPATHEAATTPVAQVPAPAKVSTPDNGPKEFDDGLKTAASLSASARFTAASALLKNLGQKYASAAWFESVKGAWEKLDRTVQQQLIDFTAEADDARERAAKSEKLEYLAQMDAAWKKKLFAIGAPLSTTEWFFPETVAMLSTGGATFARLADSSILVSGNNPDRDTYTIQFHTSVAAISALRLEVLPDDSLPAKGPGRGGNGNFALSKLTVDAEPLGGKPQRLSIANPSASFEEGDAFVRYVLDDDPNTRWAVMPRFGQPTIAVFPFTQPAGGLEGTTFSVILDFQSGNGQHGLGRFRFSLTTANPPPSATTASAPVPAATASVEEVAAVKSRQVLKSIADARTRLLDAARQKKLAALTTQLDTLEKQVKSHTKNADAAGHELSDIETAMVVEPDVGDKLIERTAGLRFDMGSMKDGEWSMYKTTVHAGGNGVEIQYDFSSPEQYSAWIMDKPNNSGDSEHDAKAGAVVVKTVGHHNWDGKDRRETPVFKLPLYLKNDTWTVETNVTLLADGNKKDKPDYGILVWDGGSNVARLSIKDATVKDVQMLFGASTPAKENFWSKGVYLPGRPKDRVRLQMNCSPTQVVCLATNAAGRTATYVHKEPLNFEPRFVGLFCRTNDGGENARVQFDNVKIVGVPNRERLKEAAASSRNAFITAAKTEYAKKSAAAK